jgi:peptidoglycan/xylan/chitin deacetylase (PgdA/CDA1 family)
MLFLALIPAVAAWNKADYPKPFQLATSDVQWIKEFLKGKDIPNISIRKENSPSDWSKDKTTCVGGNDWALTYDDGSSNNTQLALDALAGSNNKKATFFVTGSQIVENPDMLKKTFDAGHQIGIHT